MLPFNCPAIWTQSINHLDGECYFCTIKRPRLNESIKYVDCSNCKIPKNNSINLAKRVPPEESDVTSDNEANSGSEFSLEEEEPNFQWSPSVFADFCRELHLSKKMSQKCFKMLKTHSCMKSSLKDVTTRAVQNRSSNLHNFFRPVVALPIVRILKVYCLF